MAIGVIDHAKLMRAIELFGTKVAPEVRKATTPTFPLDKIEADLSTSR